MIDIKVGQIYSFHSDPSEPIIAYLKTDKDSLISSSNTVFEVSRSYGVVGLLCIKSRDGQFTIGTEYIDKPSDVQYSGHYRLIWDPAVDGLSGGVSMGVVEHGVDCIGCKKYYPHAVRSSNFKCWSCRNGF